MIDLSLINETTEIISSNFKASEIEDLGRIMFDEYSGHRIAGVKTHVTMSPRKCAQTLVQYANTHRKTFNLIQLIIEMDESPLNGKIKYIEGLESYMNKLAKTGIHYDFKKRKLHHTKKDARELKNWGALKDGKTYSITVMSLDIVGNSKLVKKHGTGKMEKVYYQLRNFVEQKIHEYDGRIWSFAGDGGLIAFTFKNHATRAALCSLDIQSSLPIFNIRPEIPITDQIVLRMALDTGKIKYVSNTGHIVSDVINYAAHLEKQITLPGEISISGNMKKEVHPRIAEIFRDKGFFENSDYFSTI